MKQDYLDSSSILNIPRNLPPNFATILTCKTESSRAKKWIQGDETFWHELTLGTMVHDEIHTFIQDYLSKYNKVNFLKCYVEIPTISN